MLEWGQKNKVDIRIETNTIKPQDTCFESIIYIGLDIYGKGKGVCKKEAEQCAARTAILKLRDECGDYLDKI